MELEWTRNKPISGYYYLCRNPDSNPDTLFVFVENGWFYIVGDGAGTVDAENGMWAGPINLPPPPTMPMVNESPEIDPAEFLILRPDLDKRRATKERCRHGLLWAERCLACDWEMQH